MFKDQPQFLKLSRIFVFVFTAQRKIRLLSRSQLPMFLPNETANIVVALLCDL